MLLAVIGFNSPYPLTGLLGRSTTLRQALPPKNRTCKFPCIRLQSQLSQTLRFSQQFPLQIGVSMVLSVTIWMEQPEVRNSIGTAINSTDKMMNMPSGDCCYSPATDGATPSLSMPQIFEFMPAGKVLLHLQSRTRFEILLEVRIVRICLAFNFDVSQDGYIRCVSQYQHSLRSIFPENSTIENMPAIPHMPEVSPMDPALRFVWVPTACPCP